VRDVAAIPGGLRADNLPARYRSPGSSRWSLWLPPLILLLLAILPYLGSLSNGFVYDDDTQILANPYIQNFSHLKQIFTTTAWSYKGGAAGVSNYYRPLMTFGYLLIHEAVGDRPFAYHLANLLTNAAVVLVLYLLTFRMFGDRALAFIASAVFALHPIHTEPVNWIAAITDLELTLFFLLTFWCFLGLGRLRDRRWWLEQCGLLAGFFLCLLSKEQAMMLPLLATIYEHFYRPDRNQSSILQKLSRYGALWVMEIGYLIFRIQVLGAFAPLGQTKTFSSDEIIFYAAGLTGQYLKKIVWPVHLHVYYAFPTRLGEWIPEMLEGILALGLFALAFYLLWRRARPVSFGCVWFALTLAPVLNVRLLPNCLFAERYLYLPSAGFCWIVAWGAVRLWNNPPRLRRFEHWRGAWRKAMAAGGVAIAALSVVRIVTHNSAWKNDRVFYQSALANAPSSADMHNDLGIVYWKSHEWPKAEVQWRKAYQLAPNAVYVLDNLGLLCYREKRYGEAEFYLHKALELGPRDVSALVDLGQTEKLMGNRAAAEVNFREAVAIAPLNVRALLKLGELLQDESEPAEAAVEFSAALRSQPTPEAYYGLGLAEWAQGNTAQAEQTFLKAEGFMPSDSRCHFLLGLLYENTGRPKKALKQYQIGLRTDPSNATVLAAVSRLSAKAASPPGHVLSHH
jgi:protein O-mannosyl-transferase